MIMMIKKNEKPLQGLKVLELGTLIAGPFATRILAEFGAEVIKVEHPNGGDPLRKWRKMHKDTSLWWYVQARNKKSVTADLKAEKGQEIIRDLARECDIVIENFKPGSLEKWGIGYEQLSKVNPGIIMARVSGYGQTGPYRDKPGFGSIGEAMGGLRYLTGYPDLPPTRVGISLGDSVAALYAVIGVLMAVHHRDKSKTNEGQYIDVALFEAVYSLMESVVPEFDFLGFVRERSGSALEGIAPSNTYKCQDGKYIVIAGNSDSIFKRLMAQMGRSDIGEDPAFASNELRANRADYLDAAIEEWTSKLSFDEVLKQMEEAQVPTGPIYSVEDMFRDQHFQERELFEEVDVDGLGKLKIPGIVPKFSKTPGKTEWVGPKLGEHNEQIYKDMLQYTDEKMKQLKDENVI